MKNQVRKKKIPLFLRQLIKATGFWKSNALILGEFKYFPKIILLAVLFTLLAAVFEGAGIGAILAILTSLIDADAPPLRTGVEWFDIWVLAADSSAQTRLFRVSALLILMTAIRAIFTYFAFVYVGIGKLKLGYQLRLRIFEQLQRLPLSYFSKVRSGGLLNSMTNEIQQIMQAFNLFNVMLIQGSLLLVYLASMFLMSWQLSLLSIVLFGLLSYGVAYLLRNVRQASSERSTASSRHVSIFLEFINGVRTVHAFAAHRFERKRFDKSNQDLFEASTKTVSIMSLAGPLVEGVASTVIIVMIVLAVIVLVPAGKLQLASLLTFLFVLFRVMPLVKILNASAAGIKNFHGSFEKISQVLRVDDKPYIQNGYLEFPGLEQAIVFNSVDFGYEPSSLVLRNINLTIEKGKTTALVGSSGAGKSTLADLIPRFYDPTRGQVLIDGTDLRKFNINSYRRKLSVVSQDTFIFNDTIRNNIAYALEDVPEEEILQATRLSNSLEFIQKLPEGFDTVLGDRGVRLSGGQRQRIAIARSLLRHPEILILDEATSALDSVSEQLIQDSIEKLSVGRTVVVIAHRLSTIVKADKVVVLEKGKIVEQGTYQELLNRKGQLWEYHNMQFGANTSTERALKSLEL